MLDVIVWQWAPSTFVKHVQRLIFYTMLDYKNCQRKNFLFTRKWKVHQCDLYSCYSLPVGIIANAKQSQSANASVKASHFVQLCSQRRIPIVFLTNHMGGTKSDPEISGDTSWSLTRLNEILLLLNIIIINYTLFLYYRWRNEMPRSVYGSCFLCRRAESYYNHWRLSWSEQLPHGMSWSTGNLPLYISVF